MARPHGSGRPSRSRSKPEGVGEREREDARHDGGPADLHPEEAYEQERHIDRHVDPCPEPRDASGDGHDSQPEQGIPQGWRVVEGDDREADNEQHPCKDADGVRGQPASGGHGVVPMSSTLSPYAYPGALGLEVWGDAGAGPRGTTNTHGPTTCLGAGPGNGLTNSSMRMVSWPAASGGAGVNRIDRRVANWEPPLPSDPAA